MAGHAQLKFVMTECSKTQIRLTGLIWHLKAFSAIFGSPCQQQHPSLAPNWLVVDILDGE